MKEGRVMRYVLGYEGYIEYEADDGTRVRYQKSRPSDYHIGTYNTGVWPNQIPATGTVCRAHRVDEYPSDELVDAVHALLLAGHADHLAAAERLEWPLTEEERVPPARPRPVRFDTVHCRWVDVYGRPAHQEACARVGRDAACDRAAGVVCDDCPGDCDE